ncbi:hypothetical protein ABW21_db0200296 [Orbilia brochopaga]|nr:hypothetical protein ABW21_db0200296 [Drechslerella brochopaga]
MHIDKRLLLPLASIPLSSAYFLSFELKPPGLFTILPSPSDEDGSEEIFDPSTLERPGTSFREPASALDLSNVGIVGPQEIDLGRPDAAPVAGLNIAGRIQSLPSRQIYQPIADYSGNRLLSAGGSGTGRRLSTFFSDELSLSENTNEQPLLIQTPTNVNTNGVYTAAASIPPSSGGRCIEFQIDREGLMLQSMTFSTFADDDVPPVAISIFSIPGCRANTQVAYIDDLAFPDDETTIDLSYIEQPVSNRFSALPVYITAAGSQTLLVSGQDIAEEYGRPRAPVNVLDTSIQDSVDQESLNLEGDLLPGDDDYWADFDTPWDQLRDDSISGRVGDDVEEFKGTTPPRRNRPRPLDFYAYPAARRQPGSSVLQRSRSLGSSPYVRPFDAADDGEETAQLNAGQNLLQNPLAYANFAEEVDEGYMTDDFDESIYLDGAWWLNRDPQSGGLDPSQRRNGPSAPNSGSRGI